MPIFSSGLDGGLELLVLDEDVVRRVGRNGEDVDPGVGQGPGDRGEEADQAERQDHVEGDHPPVALEPEELLGAELRLVDDAGRLPVVLDDGEGVDAGPFSS